MIGKALVAVALVVGYVAGLVFLTEHMRP